MTPNNPMTEGEALAVLRELVLRVLASHTTEMEGYSYFSSNPGVPKDSYNEVADEIAAALTAHTAASGGEVCPRCKGAGEYEGFARHASGDPQDDYAASVQCEHCKGTGEVAAPPSTPVGVCQRCAGSGTVAATDTTRGPDGHDFDANCPHCDGTGDVHRADGEWLGTCVCAATQQPAQAAPGDGLGWEENVSYLLDRFPHAVRVREGGGPESLVQSLIVTFMKLEKLATPPGDDAAGGGHG